MNSLTTGSTRSGKTLGKVKDVVLDVDKNGTNVAVVIPDPHVNSLGWGVLAHLVARGHGHRILFDRLSNLDRVLAFRSLRPSHANNPLQRQAENEESARAFADVICRRRGLALDRFPLMEEWVMADALLYLEQQDLTLVASLLSWADTISH
jgi:hypothetical protein